MSSGYTPTFGDWTAVAQTYGSDIANMLQQNNIPLSQVAQTVAKAYPNYSYGASGTYSGGQSGIVQSGGQGTTSSPSFTVQQNPATQAVQQFFSGSGGGGQGTVNMSGANNPNFQTSLLGAQALEAVGLNPTKTATINPSPADTPTSSQFAQSGVSAVSSPTQVDISGYKMPTPGASMPAGTGTVFNAAQQPPPTVSGAMPVKGGIPGVAPDIQYTQPTRPELRHGVTPQPISPYITPAQQPTGAQFGQTQPFAMPPPAPNISATMPTVTPPTTPTITGPISGLSAMATPPGPPSLPAGYGPAANVVKHMAGGGQVGAGNTDTVPAMLTPGEYVINRDAAQQIGRGRLDRLNAEAPRHMQGGGEVYAMGADAQNPTQSSDAQSYAFNMLSPQEQVALQGGGTAAQRVQQKYNQLVNNYQGSSGSPTPMWAQSGGANPANRPIAQVHPQAPAAPAGGLGTNYYQTGSGPRVADYMAGRASGPPAQNLGYSGSLDQWLSQYGHTPQGQAYIAQNGNVGEVQRYLQNLTTPQTISPGSPAYGTAPRASLVSPPAGYGPAPRAQLVGLPPGQGEAYDPKTYGINTGGPNIGGSIASGIGQIGSAIAQGLSKVASTPYHWLQNAIPSPSDFKSQTPDIVLQGHQVGQPNTPGGYVLMAQPHDQGGQDNTGYPQSPYGINLS